jgi:hypothetical protein
MVYSVYQPAQQCHAAVTPLHQRRKTRALLKKFIVKGTDFCEVSQSLLFALLLNMISLLESVYFVIFFSPESVHLATWNSGFLAF